MQIDLHFFAYASCKFSNREDQFYFLSSIQKLAPGFLKTKQFGVMDWYNHVTSPLSPREENLLDLDTTDCEGEDDADLDISWVKDLDRVQPLETCFDLMLDEQNYKVNAPLYDLYL